MKDNETVKIRHWSVDPAGNITRATLPDRFFGWVIGISLLVMVLSGGYLVYILPVNDALIQANADLTIRIARKDADLAEAGKPVAPAEGPQELAANWVHLEEFKGVPPFREHSQPDSFKIDKQGALDLAVSVQAIDNRLHHLEGLLDSDPEKAMELTLLKRDFQEFQTVTEISEKAGKDEVEKVYDMVKWLGGLLFTLVLSLIGLLFSNVYFRKKEDTGMNVRNKELEELRARVQEMEAEKKS